jgi:4-diphosphocytidyl-2-C-methyl-D-erythritol kinase
VTAVCGLDTLRRSRRGGDAPFIMTMAPICELAPAKVNLTLKVLGRRPDGYHELESLVAFADVGDRIILEPAAGPRLETTGPFAAAIEGENLVATALARLERIEPRLTLGRVTLEKSLPVAAGLGGGSADAAAVLRAVRKANPRFSEALDWRAIAARLGADVTVCLASRPAFIWGIGEKVRLVDGLPRLPAVLVNPRRPLLTAATFRELRAGPASMRSKPPVIPGPFATVEDLIAHLGRQGNDLERPAMQLLPAIADIMAALIARSGCLLARLSGSGPTCYGLFDAGEAASEAAAVIADAQPDWWVRATELGSPSLADVLTG